MITTSRQPSRIGSAAGPPPGCLTDYAMVPITACIYALIVSPLLAYFLTRHSPTLLEPDWGARIFWPAMAVTTAILVMRNSARLGRLVWPPHILLSVRVPCVRRRQRDVGLQAGELVHQVPTAGDGRNIHRRSGPDGGSKIGYDARAVSLLRLCLRAECFLCARRRSDRGPERREDR